MEETKPANQPKVWYKQKNFLTFLIGAVALIGAAAIMSNHIDNPLPTNNTTEVPTVKNITTTVLAKFPDSFYQAMTISGGVAKNLKGIAFSPDGTQVAYVVNDSGKSSVYLNNTPGKLYDTVSLDAFAFTPDSKHYFYTASSGKDYFVVVDGVEQQHFPNGISDSDIMISDQGVPAYVINNYGDHVSQYVVFNNHPGKTHDYVEYLHMAPDGKSVAYYGCDGDSYVNKSLLLSQGTGFCSYITQSLYGSEGGSDGVFFSHGVDEAIYHASIIYSTDGKLEAYTARLGNSDSIIINGVKTYSAPGDYTDKNISEIVFSKDSMHNAYVVQGCDDNHLCQTSNLGYAQGGVYYTVLDNNEIGAKYDQINNLLFDPNNNLAFFAKSNGKWFLVIGNKTSPLPSECNDGASNLTFSNNNSYMYTCVSNDHNYHLIQDGKDIATDYYIGFPEYTKDNKIVYFSNNDKNMSLVFDGQRFTHDVIIPIFSLPKSIYGPYYELTNDGHIIYGSIDGQNLSITVN